MITLQRLLIDKEIQKVSWIRQFEREIYEIRSRKRLYPDYTKSYFGGVNINQDFKAHIDSLVLFLTPKTHSNYCMKHSK